LRGGTSHCNKPLAFGADQDHDSDPEIFNGIFATARVRILPWWSISVCEF